MQVSLKTQFGKGKKPGMDKVCSTFGDSAGDCSGLVSTIKSDFESKLEARKTHDDKMKKEKDWFEEKDPKRPNIDKEATKFCTDLWKLLELPS